MAQTPEYFSFICFSKSCKHKWNKYWLLNSKIITFSSCKSKKGEITFSGPTLIQMVPKISTSKKFPSSQCYWQIFNPL